MDMIRSKGLGLQSGQYARSGKRIEHEKRGKEKRYIYAILRLKSDDLHLDGGR